MNKKRSSRKGSTINSIDSKNVNYSIAHRDKLNSLRATLQQQTAYLSTLRRLEVQALSSSESSSKLNIKSIYQKVKLQERQIEDTQQEIQVLELYYSSKKDQTQYPRSSAPTAVPSSVQTSYYPPIDVGDYCDHKSYGKGIVYFKADAFCKILFTDKLSKTFFYQDPDFKTKKLVIKNSWERTHGKYTHSFPVGVRSVPLDLLDDYISFIESQNKELCSAVSKLRLYTKDYANDYSSSFYAQHALDCIYNIEHGQQVFLSLQSKTNSSTKENVKSSPPPKKFPIPSAPVSKPSNPASTIQFKPSTDTLYVYSGRIKCIRNHHTMVCANAHIETASGKTAILNVNCCLNCNRFYISYNEYAHYMEKYKSLLARIVLVNENGNNNFTNNLAAESMLKLCGYTVSQEKGFTSKERANLLSSIIHNHIVSKSDVIQHLN